MFNGDRPIDVQHFLAPDDFARPETYHFINHSCEANAGRVGPLLFVVDAASPSRPSTGKTAALL